MNILICDDDKLYIDMIRKYVDEFFADHKITDYKVYEYNSGDEAAKNNEKIDIAFLSSILIFVHNISISEHTNPTELIIITY
jgi:two-component system, LytTR family, response regulator